MESAALMCMRSQELRAALRDTQCPRTFSARAAGAGAGGGLAVDSRGAELCGARRRLAHYVVVKDSHAQAAAEHAGIAGSSAAAAGCQLSALEEHAGDHCRHLGVLHSAPVRLGLWAVCGQGAGAGSVRRYTCGAAGAGLPPLRPCTAPPRAFPSALACVPAAKPASLLQRKPPLQSVSTWHTRQLEPSGKPGGQVETAPHGAKQGSPGGLSSACRTAHSSGWCEAERVGGSRAGPA